MVNALTMAEMAQPANNAGMNYEGIFNYVKTQISSETKKQVGMNVMTHSYVTAMRQIANDQEIVYCFMKEMLMNQSPVFSKTLDVDNQNPSTKMVKTLDNPSMKTTRMTKRKLVESAIQTVQDLPIPDPIDSKYSYMAHYLLKRSNGELILDKTEGWNMNFKVLEYMKTVERIRMEDRYKNMKTVEVGDYTVYIISNEKILVTHFNKTDGVEEYWVDYSQIQIPEEAKDAIWLESIVATLPENTSCDSNENEETEDSLWADSASEDIGQNPEKGIAPDEQHLIETAVEMSKSREVGVMTDKNAPYFVQDEYKVTDTGELQLTSRPFSRNIRIDEIDSFKDSHKKRAQTYNASYVTCTDDYTAYIIDGGKTVCVFYYNTKGMSVTA